MLAATLCVLAWPWFVHAGAVGLSALGATPLARGPAIALLVAAMVFSVTLSRFALRERSEPAGRREGGAVREAKPRGADAPRYYERSEPAGRREGGAVRGAKPRGADAPRDDLPRAARVLAGTLSCGGLVAFVAPLLASLVLPIIAYDALAYRLPVIAQWLDAGRVAWVATDDPVRNGYPLGQEAVSAVIAAATGSLRFAGATSFAYVAGGALSLWLLAECLGVRRPLARASAALFLLVPMVILNAPSGYVDASFAGATVALLAAIVLFCDATLRADGLDGPGAAKRFWWSCVLAGLSASHVLALKGTGVAIVGVATFCAAVAIVLPRARPLQSLLPHVVLAVALAVPGTFWLVRNVVHTGNPLWPVELRALGHTFRGVAPMASVLDIEHNTPESFRSITEGGRILRSWLELTGPAHDFDERTAGLGIAWIVVALPAIAVVVARRSRPLVLLVVMTAACFAVQPMRWWPRYTIWIWGAGAIAIALCAEQLARVRRNTLLIGGLSVLCVLCFLEGSIAVAHACGAGTAPRVSPRFWDLGLDREQDVCRGAWKPGTDDASLDGVFAQLVPRPRVHLIPDDTGTWLQTRSEWARVGCSALLLFRGSPVLAAASADPTVTVQRAVAFDPLFVVRRR